ncbi:MAG: ZIP family metal transporter [Bacteroidales bacterium]|jgi:zinc and cadmium transporter
MLLIWIIAALLFGSAGSVCLAGTLLFLRDNTLNKVSSWLVSLAGGTLLGAAFLGMLPKATALTGNGDLVFNMTLGGIIAFFVVEKVILWRICNNVNCERHRDASANLILFGDAFHNFIDGIIIAAAFFSSFSFGLIVTFSVFAHEIPQELADFGVLISNGYSRKKALWYNMLSSAAALPGGVFAYFALDSAEKLIPWVLCISAASFIYIALADLVPQMHGKTRAGDSVIQIGLIMAGILIIYFIKHI